MSLSHQSYLVTTLTTSDSRPSVPSWLSSFGSNVKNRPLDGLNRPLGAVRGAASLPPIRAVAFPPLVFFLPVTPGGREGGRREQHAMPNITSTMAPEEEHGDKPFVVSPVAWYPPSPPPAHSCLRDLAPTVPAPLSMILLLTLLLSGADLPQPSHCGRAPGQRPARQSPLSARLFRPPLPLRSSWLVTGAWVNSGVGVLLGRPPSQSISPVLGDPCPRFSPVPHRHVASGVRRLD